uniref:FAD-binding PCMH-type domain-containing protein n=1 Tax=Salix viminalis TaxID=40686 RepID=A0A6N2LNV2_SALVM
MAALIMKYPSPLFLFVSFALLYPSLLAPEDQITSCLTRQDINNFTTFPRTKQDEDSTRYYKLLNFSIQNLRFTKPTTAKPLAIILPESSDELVKSVKCCREALLEIRVRCGGHSYEGTSFVDNDGAPFVIIDMMNLNKVSVDLETETAWVEGGATLGETYSAISEASSFHGFSAGSCPTVGVGGHIGGGGFGLLSRKYGLAADNVVDALLMDADGRLLDRKAMGEDVFWAIRGGGGGAWGVIYAWKIRLLRVPEVVTGFIVSRPGTKHHVAELVNAWQGVAPTLAGDFYLSCFVGGGLPGTKTRGISATFKGFYLGPRNEMVSILHQVFPELAIETEDCKEMSWIESILFFSGLISDGKSSVSDLKNRYLKEKNYFKAKSDYVRRHISLEGIRTALEILEKEPQVLVEWKEEDDSKSNEYIRWIREFYTAMTPFVSFHPRAAYINYMDFDLGSVMEMVPARDAVEVARVWGEKYFLRNYDRLVEVKTYIDPDNVFRINKASTAAVLSSDLGM